MPAVRYGTSRLARARARARRRRPPPSRAGHRTLRSAPTSRRAGAGDCDGEDLANFVGRRRRQPAGELVRFANRVQSFHQPQPGCGEGVFSDFVISCHHVDRLPHHSLQTAHQRLPRHQVTRKRCSDEVCERRSRCESWIFGYISTIRPRAEAEVDGHDNPKEPHICAVIRQHARRTAWQKLVSVSMSAAAASKVRPSMWWPAIWWRSASASRRRSRRRQAPLPTRWPSWCGIRVDGFDRGDDAIGGEVRGRSSPLPTSTRRGSAPTQPSSSATPPASVRSSTMPTRPGSPRCASAPARDVDGRGRDDHARHRHRHRAVPRRRLVPNTELGHIQMRRPGRRDCAAARIKEEHDESWKKWGAR